MLEQFEKKSLSFNFHSYTLPSLTLPWIVLFNLQLHDVFGSVLWLVPSVECLFILPTKCERHWSVDIIRCCITPTLHALTSWPWLNGLDGPACHIQRLFKFILHSDFCPTSFLTLLYHQREWCSLGGAHPSWNVWLSVRACCLNMQAAISQHHRKWPAFALKSQQSFHYSYYLQRHEAAADTTPSCTGVSLHSLSLSLLCCSPLRTVPPNAWCEFRTSIY